MTGDESWIYAYESESKQQSTVWVFQDGPNPTKVAGVRSTSKQMIACFFGQTEEAIDAFRIHVLEIRQSEWQKCFDNWYKRMQK